VNVKELAQAYREAEKEFQFAIASGDMDRLKVAKANKRLAFAEYSKAKKAELRRSGF
jgi:hypothetical protein